MLINQILTLWCLNVIKKIVNQLGCLFILQSNNSMKIFFWFFLFLLYNFNIIGQKNFAEVNFKSPIGIPILLSGNFAELRSNHFHTGIDIKTRGVSGYKIYAVDSGFVSRINVSHWGYGNALYIDHPSGYTSVYGHLSKFSNKIQNFVRQQQYKQQSETVTLYLDSSEFPLACGEVVALSGNSGSSSGPHLHFEIRETKTEKPVNPLLFNFEVKDNIPPSIFNIKLYPLDAGFVNGSQNNQLIPVQKSENGYQIKQKIVAQGEIGLGIHTVDKLNQSSNICGIYSIKMFVNGKLYFLQKMDKLDFSTNRYINTHKDYLEHKINRRSIHKSFLSDNNDLDIYVFVKNDGKIKIEINNQYAIKYIVTDVNGNKSELNFVIKGDTSYKSSFNNLKVENYLNAVSQSDSLVNENVRLIMPEKSMYQPEVVSYKEGKYFSSTAPLYSIMNENIPVHKKFILSIKLKDTSMFNNQKAVMVHVGNDEKRVAAKGGSYSGGWISSTLKKFGNYTVLVDSVAPKIRLVNVYDGKNISKLSYLQFKISDDLSGIKKYNAFIDNQWVLSKYNPRTSDLKIWELEWKHLSKGKHTLKLVIEDERQNSISKSIHINY